MRAALVLAILAACSPFGSGDDDAPATPSSPTMTKPPIDAGPTGPHDDGGVIVDAGPQGPVPPACSTTLVTKTLDFESDFDPEWKALMNQGGTIARVDKSGAGDAALFRGKLGHFESTTSSEVGDGATVLLASNVVAAPQWARVEWDAAVLQADPYAAFGCTIGPVDQNESGRAYLATEHDGDLVTGVFPTLDSWWNGNQKNMAPRLGSYVPSKWQHFALQLTFGTAKLSVKASVDGSESTLTDAAWQPPVNAITMRCGALYEQAAHGASIATKIDIDNVVFWVCPK
jgi:hypothetical protein